MTRDQQSLQVPLRAASAHSQAPEFGNDSQEDLRSEKSKNRTSKASKVLGTSEIPSQQSASPRDDTSSLKRRKGRPSFMKSSLSPFPSANHEDADSSTGRNMPQLRVRASSPLLGAGSSHAQDGAAPKRTLHPSGSSNALFSYFSSRDAATADSNDKQARPETSSQSVHSKGSKSSKRKLRPPRIDLSLLFPKPKPASEPLLSPQRMVHSPTPLSAVGEFPRSIYPEARSPPGARRYTAAQSPTQPETTTTIATIGPPPPVPPSAVLRPTSHRSAPADRSSAISTETNWLDPPPHRTVRTSDMDTALQNYSAMQDRQQREEQRQWYQREQERVREREKEREKERGVEREKEQEQEKEREREREQQEKEKQQQLEQQQQQQQEQQQQQRRQREQEEEQRRQQEKQQHDSSAASIYSRSQERSQSSYSKRSDGSPYRMSSGGWSKETYLSPKSRPQVPQRPPGRLSPSPDRRPGLPRPSHSADNKSFASKKSTKSSGSLLASSDLSTSSVLCLSSSDDEDDDDTPRNSSKPSATPIPRESVTTYGDFEPEICTASAAQATQGRAVKRVDLHRQLSASMGGGTMLRSPTIHRNPSMSSAGRSSSAGRREVSQQRSSGIPTISEPNKLSTDRFPAPAGGNAVLSAKEISRRSRVISVTRQEETLLEAMRQRKGKVTPSLFHEARYSQNTTHSHPLPTSNPAAVVAAAAAKETTRTAATTNPPADSDQGGTPPSRDSQYSAEMSFLRLSASIQSRTDEGAAHTDKDGHPSSSSQGTASDAEQKTLNSRSSPRTSLGYTDSLPSPSTSGTSPLTPTLPIHRFSTLSTQSPPPNRPPPAVPTHDQRQHSRRRTDSSEAIVLGEEKSDTKEAEEFPIWALGWAHDQNLTTVH